MTCNIKDGSPPKNHGLVIAHTVIVFFVNPEISTSEADGNAVYKASLRTQKSHCIISRPDIITIFIDKEALVAILDL